MVCSEAHSHCLAGSCYVCLRHLYILLLLPLPYLRVYIIFSEASQLTHTFAGFNNLFESRYTKDYLLGDWLCAEVIRDYMHAG